jgi:hypothetical protein
MRSPTICLIALAVAIILLAQPVAALPIMRVPFVSAGPVWSLNPSEIADLVIIEANSSHMVADNSAALAISFLPAGGGTSDGLAIAPVIAQTSSLTIACDHSYFFQDFTVL